MTLESILSYIRDNQVAIRIDYIGREYSVMLMVGTRAATAEAATFEDAFELARMRYEAGWKVGR